MIHGMTFQFRMLRLKCQDFRNRKKRYRNIVFLFAPKVIMNGGTIMDQRNKKDIPDNLEINQMVLFEDNKLQILKSGVEINKQVVECEHYRDVVNYLEQEPVDHPATFLILGMGLVLASVQEITNQKSRLEVMNQAIYELSHVNSRNSNEKSFFLEECLKEALDQKNEGRNITKVILSSIEADWNHRCLTIVKMAKAMEELLTLGQTVLLSELDSVYEEILLWTFAQSNKQLDFLITHSEDRKQEELLLGLTNHTIDIVIVQGELIARNGSTKVSSNSSKYAKTAKENQIPVFVMGIPSQDLYSGRDFKLLEPEYEKLLMPSVITEIITDKGSFRPEYLEGSFEEYNSEFY